MILIILYVLAVVAFGFWILGWSLWHSSLAITRFFMAHTHKRLAAPQFPARAREVLPLGAGQEVFKIAPFQAGRSNRSNLSL
jgi:hypothetical protein